MTDDSADAFARHEAFERREDDREGYDLTTTVLETAVRPHEEVEITVTVPSLDAAVAGETVADVVADGWFETLERRLADAYRVASGEGEGPTVERGAREIRVRFAYDSPRPAADAKALIEYVEGTYVQGLIPGYEYRGPAGALLSAAKERGEQGAESAGEGSEPPV
ncbi:DUF5813 family protein [Saliphagus infecundisoli]|uniref:DUF5813 family protein n=1 Tax=Saliphagus infecundisoli TaxID=1849069 RepID=A0ABD5QDT2_9EURY|nr:DUF5813 family protein [Saliphagus infecundisoli]